MGGCGRSCAESHSLAVLWRRSTYTDDITVFVSHLSDIIEVQQVVGRCEKVAWAKINGGLEILRLESHWIAERLVFLSRR